MNWGFEQMEENKIFTNGKYFERYYVLNVSLRFTPTNEGFCANRKVNVNVASKHVRKDEGCDM